LIHFYKRFTHAFMRMYTTLNLRALGVLTLLLFFVAYLYVQRSEDEEVHLSKAVRSTVEAEGLEEAEDGVDWKKVDLTKPDLPAGLEKLAKMVKVVQEEMVISGVSTFIQRASPPSKVARVSEKTVLLLHGAAFSSQTWVSVVPTIAILAAAGHHVIAIDLPGYGKTRGRVGDKGAYLGAVIDALSPDVAPVLVSPSMSGGFVVPFLADTPEKVSGWVPVAPVSTSQGRAFFPSLSVPTMIVYGELDHSLGSSSASDLKLIPTSTVPQVLAGAKHPAYLDQPDLWHKLLINFVRLT